MKWSFDGSSNKWYPTALEALAHAAGTICYWADRDYAGFSARDVKEELCKWMSWSIAVVGSAIVEVGVVWMQDHLWLVKEHAEYMLSLRDSVAYVAHRNAELEYLLLAEQPAGRTYRGPMFDDAPKGAVASDVRPVPAAPPPRPHIWDRYCAYPYDGKLVPYCVVCGVHQASVCVSDPCTPRPGWREAKEEVITSFGIRPPCHHKQPDYRIPGVVMATRRMYRGPMFDHAPESGDAGPLSTWEESLGR